MLAVASHISGVGVEEVRSLRRHLEADSGAGVKVSACRRLDDHTRLLRPGGQVIVLHIDQRGHQHMAAQRFHEVDARGHHAVGIAVVQPQMLGAHPDGHRPVR